MIIFIYGEDSYRSRQRLLQLKDAFVKKFSPNGVNVVSLEGNDLNLDEFRRACFSAGLLEKKRLIIINNLLENSKDAKLMEEIARLLEKKGFPEDNIVIFYEDGVLEKTKFQKKKPAKPKKSVSGANWKSTLANLLRREKAEEFNLLPLPKLNDWALKEISSKGGTIERAALEELVVKVGQNLWQMENEINKLVGYKKGEIITAEDVRYFVQSKFDENVFHLTDALSRRDKKEALKLIGEQLESGTEPLALLSKFIWQFRNIIQIKDLLNRGEGHMIAQKLGLHPFVAQKIIPQAGKFNMEELKKIYRRLMEMDINLKNSHTNPELLFDLLVLDFIGKR